MSDNQTVVHKKKNQTLDTLVFKCLCNLVVLVILVATFHVCDPGWLKLPLTWQLCDYLKLSPLGRQISSWLSKYLFNGDSGKLQADGALIYNSVTLPSLIPVSIRCHS